MAWTFKEAPLEGRDGYLGVGYIDGTEVALIVTRSTLAPGERARERQRLLADFLRSRGIGGGDPPAGGP